MMDRYNGEALNETLFKTPTLSAASQQTQQPFSSLFVDYNKVEKGDNSYIS